MKKVLIVAVNVNHQVDFEDRVEELQNLVLACDLEIVQHMVQNVDKINPRYYLGSGKVQELSTIVEEEEIELVIFNHELSPTQLRNLSEMMDVELWDRTTLILEIFKRRAQTKEAKLQVDIAKMKYMLPRLIGLTTNYDRQQGGAGTFNRGAGEKQISLDKRKLEKRIHELNKELESVVKKRDTQRKRRQKSGLPLIAFVGYTNAGKSSLMNYFIEHYSNQSEKVVLEKDMLFATLETSVRRMELKGKGFLVSDTVGFISQLPHDLIKAFRSTLEEVKQADLLIHLVDISNPNYMSHIQVTEETLKQLEVQNKDTILVYNKIDLMDEEYKNKEGVCYISTKDGLGMEEFIDEIEKKILQDYIQVKLLIPYSQSQLVNYFKENSDVQQMLQQDDGVLIETICKHKDYQKYKEYLLLEDKSVI